MLSKDVRETWKTGNPRFVGFRKGDKVLYKVQFPAKTVGTKFQDKYIGPYTVTSVVGNGVSYELVSEDGLVKRAHFRQLKKYNSRL